MERVKSTEEFSMLKKNSLSGHNPQMINSEIFFEGNGNILHCQKDVSLKNVTLRFLGSNSLIFLSSSKHQYGLTVNIFNNSTLYFGENNYFNPHGQNMNLILSEGKNILFGKNCLFSFGVSIRLADPHLIYNIDTKKRINPSKSVFIGDHVWIGQDALILKGTQIGSGSIIGANSVIANKRVVSNSSWAGNPAKLIRKRVFYTEDCVHSWSETDTIQFEYKHSEAFVYNNTPGETLTFDDIDKEINSFLTAKEKLAYLLSHISSNTNKNRFSLE